MENAEKVFLEFIDTGQKLQKGAACSKDMALDFSDSISHDAKDELRYMLLIFYNCEKPDMCKKLRSLKL